MNPPQKIIDPAIYWKKSMNGLTPGQKKSSYQNTNLPSEIVKVRIM